MTEEGASLAAFRATRGDGRDPVLQYAHLPAKKYSVPRLPRSTFRVNFNVSANDRLSLPRIHPTLDMASLNPCLWPADWILPLEAHPHAGRSATPDGGPGHGRESY